MNGLPPSDADVPSAQAPGILPGATDAHSAQPPDAVPDDVRQRLMQQFAQWLDRMLANEPPPAGLPEELLAASADPSRPDNCDLYSLFAALTSLSGEVRLQGRAFKQLADVLSPLADLQPRLERLEGTQLAAAQELSRLAESDDDDAAAESSLPEPKESLNVLFDLYERLARGLRTLDAAVESLRGTTSLMLRWFGRGSIEQLAHAIEAVREAQRLMLSRLDAAFHQWEIQRIGAVGDEFDPALMTAMEVQPTDEHPDGTVLEVHRGGYTLHDQVLLTAQVKVAKARD